MTAVLGQRIAPFEILSSLGAGGLGEVYRARDHNWLKELKRLVPVD